MRLDFDPSTTLFGLSIRLETLALAGVIFFMLVLTALSAGRVRLAATGAAEAGGSAPSRLRRDDLILIAFGAVPGAVVGGRLGYALIHFDYYSANPAAVADPGQGGFELTLAVLLGVLTAVAVARLLAAPVRQWLGVAGLPLLLGLGLGKLAMVLGGTGQGSYSDASWATSYVHTGLWNSINPSFAALPAQAVEGGLELAMAVVILALPLLLRLRLRRWGRIVRPGLAARRDWALLSGDWRFITVIGLWAAVRFVAAFTWRDARVLGPLVAEQIVLAVVVIGVFLGPDAVAALRAAGRALGRWRAARRVARAERTAAGAAAAATAAVEATRVSAVRAAAEPSAAEVASAPDSPAAETTRPNV
jgi:prolipoprotein diacylglyceryltransferase